MAEDEVFLTGATGFIGSHVLDALVAAGYRVRALVREGSRPVAARDGVATVVGDLTRPGELARHMDGCRYLVHVAALYSFSPRLRGAIWQTNVAGTAGLLEAARVAGIERAVVTSSSATVGPARNGRPATEGDAARGHDASTYPSTYHGSKIEQERAAVAARVPSVLLLPTAPVGPADWKPTPTGKMVLDFMRGRMFASLPGGLNLVPVEDVAAAHVVALERGRPRERYLIGGENLHLSEVWEMLATICHRPVPRREIPYGLALGLGWLDEIRCRVGAGSDPIVPLEGVRMARQAMFVSWEKAARELGHRPRPVREALERQVRWYRDQHYM